MFFYVLTALTGIIFPHFNLQNAYNSGFLGRKCRQVQKKDMSIFTWVHGCHILQTILCCKTKKAQTSYLRRNTNRVSKPRAVIDRIPTSTKSLKSWSANITNFSFRRLGRMQSKGNRTEVKSVSDDKKLLKKLKVQNNDQLNQLFNLYFLLMGHTVTLTLTNPWYRHHHLISCLFFFYDQHSQLNQLLKIASSAKEFMHMFTEWKVGYVGWPIYQGFIEIGIL